MDLYFKDFTETADLVQHITPNNNQQRAGQSINTHMVNEATKQEQLDND